MEPVRTNFAKHPRKRGSVRNLASHSAPTEPQEPIIMPADPPINGNTLGSLGTAFGLFPLALALFGVFVPAAQC
jgi:hypothetical protein